MSVLKNIFLLLLTFFLLAGAGMLDAQNFPPPPDSPKKQGKLKPSDFGIKSKKALQAFLKGRQNDQWRDYEGAIRFYEEALSMEPEFTMAAYFIAQNSYLLFQMRRDPNWLDKGRKAANIADKVFNVDNDGTRARLDYYLAEYRFYEMDYEGALKMYERFKAAEVRKEKKMELTADLNLKNARFAAEAIKEKVKFNPQNLGDNINSIGDEYLPNLTADESMLFVTARRPECTGGYRADLGGEAEDFFYSEFQKGKWQRLKNLGPPVNTEDNEGAACFTPDGMYVYFTACNRKDGFGSCDIYVSKLEGTNWSEPKNLGPLVNSPYWDSQPCISNDGNTLFFASGRPGGKGANDIWYALKINGKWTEAKNLGAPINTIGSEFSPFIHADGTTFYFSSDEHPGFGGIDLFMSKKTEEKWGEPINLGYPLNTTGDERTIFINATGDKGYINSDRMEGGFGGYDIYAFELDEKIRPEFATYVRGVVLAEGTEKPLNATVTFVNLTTKDTIRIVETNSSSGKFMLTLPLDEDYAAFVDAKGYLFSSENFSLKGLKKGKDEYFDLVIHLSAIKKGASIVLKNIFYETGSFELLESSRTEMDHLVQFMKLNPKVSVEISGHTDDVGTTDANLSLSRSRAGEVRKYLIKQGVSEERITSEGYGESQPVAQNTTDEGKARNRRTEFRILELQ